MLLTFQSRNLLFNKIFVDRIVVRIYCLWLITMNYCKRELVDMHLCYGNTNCNARAAARLYAERFPNRRHPHHSTFRTIHRNLLEYGNLKGKKNSGRNARIPIETEEEILDRVAENPSISTRELGLQFGVSNSAAWKILREQNLYPYHLQKVHALLPVDYPLRANFCVWLLNKNVEDVQFVSNLMTTDECVFSRDGITNVHNSHMWLEENQHPIVVKNHQHRFSENIWIGILHDHLIGPIRLPHRLNGELYLNFLRNVLPGLLDDVPLAVRANMWFMHDGAPPHSTLNVADFLNLSFPGRWIGRRSERTWPPRSPDLNPLDFFVWGYLKTRVYAIEINNPIQLWNRIQMACDEIRDMPQIFQRIRFNFLRRAQACIQAEGGHFEQYM